MKLQKLILKNILYAFFDMRHENLFLNFFFLLNWIVHIFIKKYIKFYL